MRSEGTDTALRAVLNERRRNAELGEFEAASNLS